jgi:PAS domain S-box-containing protein
MVDDLDLRAVALTPAELELTLANVKLGVWRYEPEHGVLASPIVGQILELEGPTFELARMSERLGAQSTNFSRGIELALRDDKPFGMYVELDLPSGQHKWVGIHVQADTGARAGHRQLLGTIQDVSELRLRDRIARESEMTLHQVEAITHIGHWSVSLTDGSIFHSDEIKRIFGYEPSEYALTIDEAIQAYHPDDRDEVIRLFNHAVATGEGYEFDLRVVQPSGAIRHVHSKGYAERDLQGKVVRVYGVFQDITDRVRAEAEKARLEAALHQSQKLEAIGRLAGGIAHDFNNILTAIFGYVDLALESADAGDEPVREGLVEIGRSSQRAAALVRQLLAFSRQQVTPADVLDLNTVLQHATSMLRRVLTEDIELVMLPGVMLPHVKIATSSLEQIIMNLVVNAGDAMPNGGALTIETSVTDIGESAMLGPDAPAAGRYVVLAVSDTGHGIAPEARARLFEPFFTTKAVGKGTGLGLSTVYGIVKQSAGHITVYSEPGHGSVFRVYLPAVHDELSRHVEQPSPIAVTGGETVLLCEDDEQVRQLSVRVLRSAGYHVLAARNGAEGLSMAKSHFGPLDLLVTDVVMPELSGRAIADILRADHPALKVLFMSGYTANVIAQRGLLERDTMLLEKPFTRSSLLAGVRAALERG